MKSIGKMKRRLVMGLVLLSASVAGSSLASPIYRIDVNTTAGFGIDTETGWDGLDATAGNGASTTVGGVTFEVFSADESRSRSSVGASALTRDFVFDDGAGQAVGLRVFGLADGIWEADVYAFDYDYPVEDQIIGITQFGSAPETIFTDSYAANALTPYTFQFDSSLLIDGFGIFTRENNQFDRARFNALELRQVAVPAPPALAVMGLGLVLIGLAKRLRPTGRL